MCALVSVLGAGKRQALTCVALPVLVLLEVVRAATTGTG